MRLTHRASRKFLAEGVIISAILVVPMYGQIRSSGPALLDLTKPVPPGEELTRLPGASIGTIGGQRVPPLYPLPLEVETVSISPLRVEMGHKFAVELLLTNTGDSTFYLPASLNKASVLKQGNTGRRTIVFLLQLEDPINGRKTSRVMVTADGSQTVPTSWLRMKPGEKVRVLFTGSLYPFAEWLKAGDSEMRVRAQVVEWKYEDRRFFIERDSATVTSRKGVSVEVVFPN